MINIHSPALGKRDGVTDLHTILHNLHYISDIVIRLHSLQHSLQRLDVAVQPQTLRLQSLDALLVITQLFEDGLIIIGIAGY